MGSRDTLAVYGISHVREYVHGLHVYTADFAYSSSLTVSSSIMRYAACVCVIVTEIGIQSNT